MMHLETSAMFWFYVNMSLFLVVLLVVVYFILKTINGLQDKLMDKLNEQEKLINRINEMNQNFEVQLQHLEQKMVDSMELGKEGTYKSVAVAKAENHEEKPKVLTVDKKLKQVLMITDELLEKLPEAEIQKFVHSNDFKLYKDVMENVKGAEEKEDSGNTSDGKKSTLKNNFEIPQEHYFVLNNGRKVKTKQEMIQALEEMEDDVFKHHTEHGRNDIAQWIKDCFHDNKLHDKLIGTKLKTEMIEAIKQDVADASADLSADVGCKKKKAEDSNGSV